MTTGRISKEGVEMSMLPDIEVSASPAEEDPKFPEEYSPARSFDEDSRFYEYSPARSSDDESETTDASDDLIIVRTIGLPDGDEIEFIRRGTNLQNDSSYHPKKPLIGLRLLALRMGILTTLYPLRYVQALIRMGYEPFEPLPSVTLFGRPCLVLADTRTFMKYVCEVDGVLRLFGGLIPKLAHNLAYLFVHDFVMIGFTHLSYQFRTCRQLIRRYRRHHDTPPEHSYWNNIRFVDHFGKVLLEVVSSLVSHLVTYPLHVITIRTVAQFIEQDKSLRGDCLGLSAVIGIYKDFGIGGFYRGLLPSLIGKILAIVIPGTLAYFLTNNAPLHEIRVAINLYFQTVIAWWMDQFEVISTTMIVNGSSLIIGIPPITEKYENWMECRRRLRDNNVLYRGSFFTRRLYNGPSTLVNGLLQPNERFSCGPRHIGIELAESFSHVPRIVSLTHTSKLMTFVRFVVKKLLDSTVSICDE